MLRALVKLIIRTRFRFSRREAVCAQIRKTGEIYLEIAEKIDPELASTPKEVPALFGVDEDMRHWSFYQVLEHNVIVNRNITLLVQSLARGEVGEWV